MRYDTEEEYINEVYADSGLGKWFGKGGKGGTSKGGWDRYNTKGEKIGKYGDSKPGEGKPKCLSATKARKLRAQGGKKAIANAVRRKKSKDPQTDRPGTGNKPINVSNRIDKDPKKKGIQDMKTFKEYCSCGMDEKSPAWTRKAGKNKEGGLNAKGRKSYERENPGSDLKAPVSAKQAKRSKGGKAAKRRKSFCARMGGMPGPMKDPKTGKPTRKALALRKWDC